MKKLFPLLLGSASLFADEAPAAASSQQGMIQTVVMIGVAFLFFYFIIWRPEKKRRRAMEEQRSSMKPGDRVTAMGIIGTIDRVDEKTIVLKTIDGSKIEILKAAITDVQSSTPQDK